MNKFFRVFDLIIDIIMIACSAGFVLFCFLQVIFRYILNSSLPWSEELCRYLFAEMVFLGSGVCILEDKHASIDLIPRKLPEKARKIYNSILLMVVTAVGILLMVFGYKFAVGVIGQKSPALQIPFQYIYSGIVAGGAVLAIDSVRKIYTTLTGKNTYYSYINPSANEIPAKEDETGKIEEKS